MTTDKIRIGIHMDVTPAQALTLKAMFEYWQQLACQGSSRTVAFFVDGDGNFYPRITFQANTRLPELTDEIREAAWVNLKDVDLSEGDRFYDFDSVAWKLHEEEEKK